MRKNTGTIEQQRAEIKRKYKRGAREKKIVNPEKLTDVELLLKKESACFLKAAGFSNTYIGEALNVTGSVVGHWFEDKALRETVAKYHDDMVQGAIKLIKTYAIEIIETLMTIARTTEDEGLAVKVFQDLLDRMGVTKVSRTESVSTNTQKGEFEITDPHGLVEKLKGAPPEIQQQAAEHMSALMAISAEHTMEDVTHA